MRSTTVLQILPVLKLKGKLYFYAKISIIGRKESPSYVGRSLAKTKKFSSMTFENRWSRKFVMRWPEQKSSCQHCCCCCLSSVNLVIGLSFTQRGGDNTEGVLMAHTLMCIESPSNFSPFEIRLSPTAEPVQTFFWNLCLPFLFLNKTVPLN